ncbi:E3 ubiquitin-protein ligase RBBP6 [Microtus ochrogaster]|uniref:E3 ubiquitin-protein ligase RBBP6 n=1 Tax=Microtus ochrogaster TaxID=79684 RepID=A0A8J6KVN9_MICOH|nr:E3 ubiquitin-protein ligase RBBP6 [Microtus ochrogaster]
MPCVHYKFASKLNYDIITFDGPHISLCDLKKRIMGKEKLKATNNDLQISSEQTKEEYTDNALIPKNSSVIVRRIPTVGVRSTRKTSVTSQVANLAETDASEEDKIKAMMLQSSQMYSPVNYVKKPLHPRLWSHIRFHHDKPGPYNKNWATNRDQNFGRRLRKSSGIPRSFMMEVKDPNMKGVMITNTGKYVIPMIDAEAYAIGKKEKPPFLPEEPSSSLEEDDAIPDELLCLICKDIMTDAAIIPCCGNSYCDNCIRTALLESDEHTCPACHQDSVSPDALVANKFLRKAVNNFKNKTGYAKRLQTRLPPPPPPVASPGQHSESSQRTQGPSPPATPVAVPGPPPPLDPPPPHMWPLPSCLPPPQYSLQFPPGLPPPAGYSVPPPGFSPAPANIHGVSPGFQTAHSNTIPTTQALPLSREEFYRVQRQLREEEKENSKLELANNFAKELTEYKKIQKAHRRSSSRNSHSYSKSRSGSTRSCSYSQSFIRVHSSSYSRSPPYPRRGRDKSRSWSGSRGYHRSRSRSPQYRRYHSRPRSQAFRGQSPTEHNVPRGEIKHEYFNRYREVQPPYDTKDYYRWSVDFRDPFEKECHQEWERKYPEQYEQYYKGYAVGANREHLPPETPLNIRNSPFIRGHREDYAAGQSHRNRNVGGGYPEKLSTRDSHNQKDNVKSKEKESDSIPGDDKENKHKKHRKQRKGEERESLPNPKLLDAPRKSRESSGVNDTKTDTLFVLPRRDDTTRVRDEPMEAESTSSKSVSETDKGEKDKTKVKFDKTKWKSHGSATAKKESH